MSTNSNAGTNNNTSEDNTNRSPKDAAKSNVEQQTSPKYVLGYPDSPQHQYLHKLTVYETKTVRY